LPQLQADSALELTVVAHVGQVANQTIKRRKMLVGLDVIHVHRMLKNPVDVPEYLLVTDELFRPDDTASSELAMQDLDLDLEGIGQVRTHCVEFGDLAVPPPRPSWPQRVGGTAMVGRGIPLRRRTAASTGRSLPPAELSALSTPSPQSCVLEAVGAAAS